MNTTTLLTLAAATAVVTAAAADKRPVPSAPDLGWLTGHWCGEREGDFIEEQWLATRGDVLLGLSRTVRGDRTRSFEYMRVELQEGVVTFIAQPQGLPPVPFRRTAGGADWARFENPAHDFPKRVEYRRTAAGLHAEIAGPGEDGRETIIPFDYLPCEAR